MPENPKELKFVYKRSPEYRTVAANGVHGGITGRGDFRFDLFVEYSQLPETVTHSITPDGVGPETGRDPGSPAIVRETQVGVVMQLEQARNFAHWILERIRIMEEKKKGSGS